MNSAVETPTLRDDWQARRALVAGAPSEHPFADVQLRVLDFLLKRYGDSPDAGRPAQFPLPSAVYVNERAVLVHHHLGRHLASGVKSPQEAQQRMASILHRMASEPAQSLPPEDPAEQLVDPTEQFADPAEQVADATEQLANIWQLAERRRQRSRRRPSAPPASESSSPFPSEATDVREAQRLRFLLADPSHAVRMQAIFALGETGTLDDVGLLMDLLALPESSDEGRGERQMLISAIEKISGTQPRGEEWQSLWVSLSNPDTGLPSLSSELADLRLERRPSGTFGIELPRPAAARWTRLQGLMLSSSLTIGVAVLLTIAVSLTLAPSPTTIYGSAALLAIYCGGVGLALYWWERTRRRQGW